MKIIEDLTDPDLILKRAWIAEESVGVLTPFALVDRRVCMIETKPALLAAGLAFCQPIDGEPWRDWPMAVIVQRDDSPFPEQLEYLTTNPRVLAAARKFATLQASGQAAAGMEL